MYLESTWGTVILSVSSRQHPVRLELFYVLLQDLLPSLIPDYTL